MAVKKTYKGRRPLTQDVCKRLSSRPCDITLQRRCVRAMKGKPTNMKRKDILMYIRRLCERITRYGSTNLNTKRAIEHRENQLYNEFDPRFAEARSITYLREHGMNAGTKYAESIQKVIAKLRNDELVKGFTILRTCKVKGHPKLVGLLDLGNEQTLCVTITSPASPKVKANIAKLNKEKWAKDGT